MNMKKNLYILLALACLCGTLSAQRKFEYRVKAGFNVGGALPIPFPAEIRKIKSYNPTMAFSDRKSTRLNSSHGYRSRMPSSA